ncbi:L7Ae/L30e/S12e/Gadd45 family ribosomal protein [Heliorestis convoluta]|uniref:Ribosomal L7Ae/L30e/S12e/Gadd45 family protein n=1 Tax=Heliorestis convoluta TaxID=356322 RepID=A0A5Q2N2X3_9FIRM|nr:L7Ae/L30e/S12e/Gadd45 family ribosomal protein [Heliorestis convoluta]QGG48219.1 ribosomal L7Ae/L30e/S12e/Gadd45 family protein [Heliorestis convoluta]
MDLEKLYALLGFARRAKQIASGETAVEANLKKGKVALLIMANDGSPHAIEKYNLWCQDLGIKTIQVGTKASLGIALGQSPRTIVAVLDEGFARAIEQAQQK